MNEENLRLEMVRYSHLLHKMGWVANHDGNISAILSEGKILCTPTAQSKRLVGLEQLIVVDNQNNVLVGTRRPFSELQLHRAAYKARPEIGCVIHAHPPTATGFAVAGISLDPPFMAEPVVSLGATIPLVPFFPPKDDRLDKAIAEGLEKGDVLMLANHGVLSVGANFEQAYLRIELVEHLSKIALIARQLGGVIPLSSDIVGTLSAKGRPSSAAKGKESIQITEGKKESRRPQIDTAKVVAEALRNHR
jgi:L-fuculose-phosphate aldolase